MEHDCFSLPLECSSTILVSPVRVWSVPRINLRQIFVQNFTSCFLISGNICISKRSRFTWHFPGRVYGFEIGHLGKVYRFWDKYSPLNCTNKQKFCVSAGKQQFENLEFVKGIFHVKSDKKCMVSRLSLNFYWKFLIDPEFIHSGQLFKILMSFLNIFHSRYLFIKIVEYCLGQDL